jgi:transposase
VRHGTVSLLAALDVTTGEVLARDVERNDAAHFIDFLAEIDAVVAPELNIHLVMDNGSSHVAKATKAWLAEHPRFHVHHTPPHASWLNQVELFFSILTSKIMGFIADYDATARPFKWTYNATKPTTADMHSTSAA